MTVKCANLITFLTGFKEFVRPERYCQISSNIKTFRLIEVRLRSHLAACQTASIILECIPDMERTGEATTTMVAQLANLQKAMSAKSLVGKVQLPQCLVALAKECSDSLNCQPLELQPLVPIH